MRRMINLTQFPTKAQIARLREKGHFTARHGSYTVDVYQRGSQFLITLCLMPVGWSSGLQFKHTSVAESDWITVAKTYAELAIARQQEDDHQWQQIIQQGGH